MKIIEIGNAYIQTDPSVLTEGLSGVSIEVKHVSYEGGVNILEIHGEVFDRFVSDTGVEEIFKFVKGSGREMKLITNIDQFVITRATNEYYMKYHPTPQYNTTPQDANYLRLLWLQKWIDFSIESCETPIITVTY